MIGERVRLAREAMKLTQKELADLAGVPIGSISSIENYRYEMRSETYVRRIAAATGFPLAFFERGPPPDLRESYFRKLKRGTAKDEKQLRAHLRMIVELVQSADADQDLELPPVLIKPTSEDPSVGAIEEIARSVRMRLGVGTIDPIPNLMRAVERAGGGSSTANRVSKSLCFFGVARTRPRRAACHMPRTRSAGGS